LLVEGFFDLHEGIIPIGITQMIASDFAAAAVLISMGALLGKLSPEQYIIMGLFEVVFYTVNEYILFDLWSVTDAGDSMTVHTFGAYFGLTVARVMYRKGQVGHSREGSSYNSDIFAMIGTIFLWVYWPSFNGGLALGDQRHRAVLNTYISLAACCLVSYAVSALLNHENKFDMVHIQNSTLAGGVAIGTSANLMIQPFGALIVGSIAGLISVVGYKYITPFLARKLNLHDTCGVNNLHGIPGILAAIVGAIVCGFASFETYGHNLYEVFPEMANGRTSWGQTGYQFAGLGVTLGIAIGGGLITGLILRLPFWIQLDEPSYFDDEDFWEVPSEPVELEQGQLYLAKRDPNGEMELEKVHQTHQYA
jgi:ammonium transporter Rh